MTVYDHAATAVIYVDLHGYFAPVLNPAGALPVVAGPGLYSSVAWPQDVPYLGYPRAR